MKNKEIERKWLLKKENLPDLSKMPYVDITQGYINSNDSKLTFRLRQSLYMSNTKNLIGEEYTMTIKGEGTKEREERESVLWRPQFSTFWSLCKNNTIHKHRYEYPGKNGEKIEIDIYKNGLEGFYTVEVEFENLEECDNYQPEEWFGEEVTEDFKYTNFYLATNPR
jgi:adenylate cyclase